MRAPTTLAQKSADAEKQLKGFISILLGTGNQTRLIRLESAAVLEQPTVEALIASAVAQARAPLPAIGRRQLIIQSVSAKQRPRRRVSK